MTSARIYWRSFLGRQRSANRNAAQENRCLRQVYAGCNQDMLRVAGQCRCVHELLYLPETSWTTSWVDTIFREFDMPLPEYSYRSRPHWTCPPPFLVQRDRLCQSAASRQILFMPVLSRSYTQRSWSCTSHSPFLRRWMQHCAKSHMSDIVF